MHRARLLAFTLFCLSAPETVADEIKVDKEKKTVSVPAKVAPRKIDDPKFEKIYPLEVVATYPYPKGKKSHETVVTFDVKPSEVHKALESLGIKAGKPAREKADKASGPEVKIYLELTPGKPGARRVPLEQFLVSSKTGLPLPKVKWMFTGSTMIKTDPAKPEEYGADVTGTLITIFPVTSDTVFQTDLKFEDQKFELETTKKLPPVGTAVNLVIQVPAAK